MTPLRTWIIVVDGGHAKFLQFVGRNSGAQTIPGHVDAKPARRTHELGRSKPPRVSQPKRPARHAIQPRVDQHEHEEVLFLKDVVHNLEVAFETNAFNDLIVLAPPRALGLLRKLIPRRMQDHVISEVDGDYTDDADQAISKVVIGLLDKQDRKSA